jgi:TonB-dependent starch-binding outer membrane protein SusC
MKSICRYLLACAVVPSTALAQQRVTISGRVSNQSLIPVSGATVSLTGTQASTATNEAGVYRLTTTATGRADTLRVTRIGYRPQLLPITLNPGDTQLDVRLAEQAVALEQVVVTGTAGNQERRAQAATVATVDAGQLVKIAPIVNVQQLLTGRVAGVSVTQTNGSVGSTSVIRIRGISSISLSNEPLVFIDGVRMDNRNFSLAGGAVSSLNDIDPNEIENIEVVKGPAAATLYGADASAGVIQIITKRGRAGNDRFTQSWSGELAKTTPDWTPPANFARCGANDILATSTSTLCRGQALNTLVQDNPIMREDMLNDGHAAILGWSARGGGNNYGYFLSYGYNGEIATVPQNGIRRQNVRTNFNVIPSRKLTVDAGMGVVRDINDQVNVGDNIYGLLAALIGSPITVGAGANGWFTPNRTGVAVASIMNRVFSTRFSPTVNVQHQTASWLTNKITLGADLSRLNIRTFFPKNDQTWYAGNNNLGLLTETRGGFDTFTLDYRADMRRTFLENGKLAADFSLGSQIIARSADSIQATGYGLATNASNTVTSTTVNSATGSRSTQRFVGYISQLQLGYRDRLYLQLGARIDQNSAFANNTESFFLPKVGISYVVSEEDFWKRFGFINTLRVRAAFGTTGRAPNPGAALQTYTNAPFVLDNGVQGAGVIPANPGNEKLRAERGQELETGFEAGMWNDRLGLEMTYFNKITKNLLLQRPIPPSLGFSQNPFINVGEVLNRGVETSVRFSPIQMKNIALDARATLATLRNELTSLGGTAPFTTGVNGINQYRENQPLGVYFTNRVKSVDVARGVAVVSDTAELAGTPIPKYEGTFSGDLTLFGNLRISGLAEFKGGHKKFNTTPYFREKSFTSEERFQRRDELPAEERLRLFGPYVNTRGGTVATQLVIENYLEDASFVRFRELSATYSLPSSWASRLRASNASITVGGRNLALWTDYSGGWDPESITYVPATGVAFAADFLTMPQPQRFFMRLNFGF